MVNFIEFIVFILFYLYVLIQAICYGYYEIKHDNKFGGIFTIVFSFFTIILGVFAVVSA